MSQDDPKRFHDQLVMERVSKTLKESTGFHPDTLTKLGFNFIADDSEAKEIEEECKALPKNTIEKNLINYLEGQSQPSQKQIDHFIAIKNSKEPNYPLIRKYFRQGNEQLLRLLLYSLEVQSANKELLQDLNYFHQHRNIHFEIIRCYLRACEEEQDLVAFEKLVEDFIHATQGTNFDALHQLKHAFPHNTEKGCQIREPKQDEQLYF